MRLREVAGTAAIIVPGFASGTVESDLNMMFCDWAYPPHQVRVIDDHGHGRDSPGNESPAPVVTLARRPMTTATPRR
jgi:hypothetical protein